MANQNWSQNIDPREALFSGGVFMRENIPRREGGFSDQTTALTTAVMTSIAVPLFCGDVISTVTVMTGNTAGGTMTHQWAALYDTQATSALIVGSQSADGTSGALAANTAIAFTLGAKYTVPADGIYYVGLMVAATTVPSLMCMSTGRTTMSGAVITGQKVLAQTSGTSLTTTAPATIATPTTVANIPYIALN
jgi:hypothetical protein